MRNLQVGILTAPTVTVTGRDGVRRTYSAADITAPTRLEGPFELHDVAIGIDFHWQRRLTLRYDGALRLVPAPGGLCAINDIPLESYLKSVISSEMSPESPLELLKAHAVISRSWLLAQLQSKGSPAPAPPCPEGRLVKWWDREDHDLFDVCADDHCQRYQGLALGLNPNVVAAIDATCGQVLMHGGRICDTRFSKCCGGRTELFDTCWGPEPHPYLTSVECPWCDTSDHAVLATVLKDYDRDTTAFHDWQVTYTPAELSDLVRRRSGIDFGHIEALEPLERGPSGRISLLRIKGSRLTLDVGKELLIRRWLSESHLYSSAFTVERRAADGAFVLRGRGWGHGVGLCQIGAAVMATRGYSYTDILAHYFPQATLAAMP